ncbi:MAG: AAA family ATPase [Candidatus Micrarchaeota archaeon]|nr:AAA family ATPase [Candidatus Micrarchaeota archaeon]
MERVKTGIPGFDDLVEGGIPKGSNVLLTGAPGAGKSIFGLQYIYEGAKEGENGIYITLDSTTNTLKNQAAQFGMDMEAFENEGKVFFLRVPLTKRKLNIFDTIEKIQKQINAKRIVFDNLAALAMNLDLFTIPSGYAGNIASSVSVNAGSIPTTDADIGIEGRDKVVYTGDSEKRLVYLIIEELAALGTTNLVITYGDPDNNRVTIDRVSEFACDGVVQLFNTLVGNKRLRTITISKMRNTNHSQYIHDLELTSKGHEIKPAEKV